MARTPNLIPYAFVTKQARRKYRTQRDTRTWSEWVSHNRYAVALVVALAFLLLVLYVRWKEQQRRRQANQSM